VARTINQQSDEPLGDTYQYVCLWGIGTPAQDNIGKVFLDSIFEIDPSLKNKLSIQSFILNGAETNNDRIKLWNSEKCQESRMVTNHIRMMGLRMRANSHLAILYYTAKMKCSYNDIAMVIKNTELSELQEDSKKSRYTLNALI